MCVGLPGKVIEVKGKRAKVQQRKHSHWVDLSVLERRVKKGDYLIDYQGVAINKIAPKQAKEILKLVAPPC